MKINMTYEKLNEWATRHHIGRKLLILLGVGATVSVIATYVMLTQATPFLKKSKSLIFLLSLDFAFLLILAAVVAKHIAALWAERKSDKAGSKLHSKMVAIFSLLAITPTIFIAAFSAIFFNIVIQSWFNQRVETAIAESIAVADSYLKEHQKVITANAEAMAAELAPYVQNIPYDSELLSQKLSDQVLLRGLDEAIVFNDNRDILGRSQFSFSLDFESFPKSDIEIAKTTPVVHTNEQNDRVRALVAINPLSPTYLLVGRSVSPTVLSRIENAENAAKEYGRLEQQGSSIALKFAAIFVGIAILLLLAAVLGGLLFADRLAKPVRNWIIAAEEVCKGNLSVRIPEEESEEFSSLTAAFNRMTEQVESQRHDLILANEQINERRQFTEAVLAGVSAGVIGLDSKGNIHLINQFASEILHLDLNKKIGKKLVKVIPEIAPLFNEIKEIGTDFIEKQVLLNREGHNHTLLVQITSERSRNKISGYVVTFDDITQLQAAQRKAAWADVARRIAHEIKNPLTPIQLAAERLKRRYATQIEKDSETFQNCVDTIIRQVEHIGRLVGEFSSFARMPAPKLKKEDLAKICNEEIFLQQQGHPEIKIKFLTKLKGLAFDCDRSQIGQVLTNLLKNAIEAIESKGTIDGFIEVDLIDDGSKIILSIADNGIGLPPEGRERLTEPYVTFREKGTGLGLAIVKKIVEDHGGVLSLHDRSGGGAVIQISFMYLNSLKRAIG
jgi:two-component system nitrogen regulation sensor histidine kinase NtrY